MPTDDPQQSTNDAVSPERCEPVPDLLTPEFEFLDSSVARAPQFLRDDPWRVLRIQSDVIQGIETMARALEDQPRAVAVFGSARSGDDNPECELARETCRNLGRLGFAIITGGSGGVMKAANRGAFEAGARSIGLNIQLPVEQELNAFVNASYMCHYFFVRKMMFAKYARGFLILPGGYGTLDELFEALTLIQTQRLADFPVVLAGSEYWNPLLDWLRDSTQARGFIESSDLDRLTVLDDAQQIASHFDGLVANA